MSSAPSLTGLPTEIIVRIVDFVTPSAHLDFARSCRRIYECSKDALKTHREAHDELFTCSDVLPTTMPNLLRRCLVDRIAAWHIRTLKLYWERAFWYEWEPYPFTSAKGTRTVTIDPQDFFLSEFYARDRDRRDFFEHNLAPRRHYRKWTEPFLFFADRTKRGLIPQSVQIVVLDTVPSGLNEGEADQIDDAIVAILAVRSTYFPNLKAIYLAALEDQLSRGHDGLQRPRLRQRLWFKNSIRAGRNVGIDIHTKTTRGPPFHDIDLPRPPNRVDLRYVPAEVLEEGAVEFDVCRGEWGAPGCGNCGRCDLCLERYDEVVWRELMQEAMG